MSNNDEQIIGDKMLVEIPDWLRKESGKNILSFHKKLAEWVNMFEKSKTVKLKFLCIDYYGVCWFRIKDN
jgi:hypothetical protein